MIRLPDEANDSAQPRSIQQPHAAAAVDVNNCDREPIHCPFAHFRKERRIKALRGKVSDNSDNLSSDGQLQGRLRAVFEIARGHAWKLVQSGLMIFP